MVAVGEKDAHAVFGQPPQTLYESQLCTHVIFGFVVDVSGKYEDLGLLSDHQLNQVIKGSCCMVTNLFCNFGAGLAAQGLERCPKVEIGSMHQGAESSICMLGHSVRPPLSTGNPERSGRVSHSVGWLGFAGQAKDALAEDVLVDLGGPAGDCDRAA